MSEHPHGRLHHGATPVVAVSDRVEYVGPPGDRVTPGEIGTVISISDGSVLVEWGVSGNFPVSLTAVVLPSGSIPWVAPEGPNNRLWIWIGEELPLAPRRTAGSPSAEVRPRDPYIEQGSHPDIVDRIWNQLGLTLPRSCRAQAKGKPVLAEAASGRIFAVARGTAYALWLVPEDFREATHFGAQTRMVWLTDLALEVGEGWIWGKWHPDEAVWLRHSYDALAGSITGRAGDLA